MSNAPKPTFKGIDRAITARLDRHPAPVIEFNRLAQILGIPAGSWWSMTRLIQPDEWPSMFRVGGSDCMTVAEAERWCCEYVRKHPKRFADPDDYEEARAKALGPMTWVSKRPDADKAAT